LLIICSTVIFVAVFTTFLTQCVDYSAIPYSKTMSEILIPQCTNKISGISNVAIWLLTVWTFWKIFTNLMDVRRLWDMHNFYLHLLNIPDSDIQTISWQDVVARLMALRDSNPLTAERTTAVQKRWLGSQSKERLDAHDIANRLMRKENYLIAMFNKEILDLTLPIPFFQGRQIFSRTIEWNLHYCILDFIFNEQGQVRQLVLKDTHRRQLSNAMRSRFLFAGFMNVICAPFIVIYLMIVYFFKYFNVIGLISNFIKFADTSSRNTKKILLLLAPVNILPWLNGSSENLTNFPICSTIESTCLTRLLLAMLSSFQR
jgi:autophagy-related protein 9